MAECDVHARAAVHDSSNSRQASRNKHEREKIDMRIKTNIKAGASCARPGLPVPYEPFDPALPTLPSLPSLPSLPGGF